jgi:hypothetical protein
MLSKILLHITCCLLPQISQKIFCENLLNLLLKGHMHINMRGSHNQQYVNF